MWHSRGSAGQHRTSWCLRSGCSDSSRVSLALNCPSQEVSAGPCRTQHLLCLARDRAVLVAVLELSFFGTRVGRMG